MVRNKVLLYIGQDSKVYPLHYLAPKGTDKKR